ncbi:protein da1-related 5 [Quercus suber]|uniref:Protein da1-related 5 n=1 Tax=Quercus suber TaxID=58331 RepID=A0AAW0JF13_QUESU
MLGRLAPTVTDIERLNQQLNRPVEETQSLIEEMTKGGELVPECLQIPRWNLYLRFKYSSKLTKLEEDILRYCQVDLQLPDTRTGLETRKIVSDISQRMDSIASVETPKVSFAVHEPPDFTVGFDMPMKELKTLLLKEEVQLLLLTAPGGCGKTTLVQMLCQDEIIKEALAGIWRVVEDIIRDLTELRSAVADEGERPSEAREGPKGGDFS